MHSLLFIFHESSSGRGKWRRKIFFSSFFLSLLVYKMKKLNVFYSVVFFSYSQNWNLDEIHDRFKRFQLHFILWYFFFHIYVKQKLVWKDKREEENSSLVIDQVSLNFYYFIFSVRSSVLASKPSSMRQRAYPKITILESFYLWNLLSSQNTFNGQILLFEIFHVFRIFYDGEKKTFSHIQRKQIKFCF